MSGRKASVIRGTNCLRVGETIGKGFDEKSLWHMVRFAEVFLDEAIVSGLGTEMVEE
jgi:hypothetical protein